MKAYREKSPSMSLKDAMKGASITYEKKQKGGNAKLARERCIRNRVREERWMATNR